MKFVFWQNILSPHQVDLINKLSEKHTVCLVVGSLIDGHRKNDEWAVPELNECVELIVTPSARQIFEIIAEQKPEEINVFSGFMSYAIVSLGMIISIFYQRKTYIYTEYSLHLSFKSKIGYYIKRTLVALFKNRVHGVFAIGRLGVEYAKKIGFPHSVIQEYCYFVDKIPKNDGAAVVSDSSIIKLLFVGRLSEDKGILAFLSGSLKDYGGPRDIHIYIIGEGDCSSRIRMLFEDYSSYVRIELIGRVPRRELGNYYENADLLLLPNIGSEGWGVVANEAMLYGVPVVCTEYSGCSSMVKHGVNGLVLSSENVRDKIGLNSILDIPDISMKRRTQLFAESYLVPARGVEILEKFVTQGERSEIW